MVSTGAIGWDGSNDAEQSGAISLTRPNDAPALIDAATITMKCTIGFAKGSRDS